MARTKGGTTIDEYIANQEPQFRPLLTKLRTVITKAVPDLEEKIMWGQPVFVKGKEKVAFVYCISDHVNFGLFRAAEVKDSKGRLEGTGKGMRHVKVLTAKDIDVPYFSTLIKAASALSPKG